MKRTMPFVAVLLAVLASGCAIAPDAREMNHMGSTLTKLSAAVDATVRYKRSADPLDEDQLLQASTAHDPGLMQAFEGRKMRILRVGRDSAVLVCDATSDQALLEDAGCTPQLDAHRWLDAPTTRCTFSLDLQQICAR